MGLLPRDSLLEGWSSGRDALCSALPSECALPLHPHLIGDPHPCTSTPVPLLTPTHILTPNPPRRNVDHHSPLKAPPPAWASRAFAPAASPQSPPPPAPTPTPTRHGGGGTWAPRSWWVRRHLRRRSWWVLRLRRMVCGDRRRRRSWRRRWGGVSLRSRPRCLTPPRIFWRKRKGIRILKATRSVTGLTILRGGSAVAEDERCLRSGSHVA